MPISGAPAGFSAAVSSRNGSTAAVYYAEQQRVIIVTGLTSQPNVTQVVDLSVFGDTMTQMAVNDNGTLLIYALSGVEQNSVNAWSPSLGHRQLTIAERVSGMALTSAGQAVVTDAGANEIFTILDPLGLAARRMLLNADNGVSNPTAVVVAPSNQIYVANEDSKSIMTLDSTMHLVRSQHCNCNVAGFYPLRESVFRLSDRTDRTIFLLEAGRDDRIVFVPALSAFE
jgi:hypothetical protein